MEAESTGGRLNLTISNTGAWVRPESREDSGSDAAGTGTGLENVKQRLAAAFPNEHNLSVSERDGRVVVMLKIYGAAQK